jgi:hypothetical protein
MPSHLADELDYYAILGVAPDASPEKIKQAYRALAMLYHPDRHAFAPDAWQAKILMREINKAYEVLGDDQKRRQYDERCQQERSVPPQAEARRPTAAQTEADDAPTFGAYMRATWQRLYKSILQRFTTSPPTGSQKQYMGFAGKILLAPIPFCLAISVSALLLQLASATKIEFLSILCVLSAVLAYPLILFPFLLRLFAPLSYRPLLNLGQKIVWTPVIIVSALILACLWFILVDREGTASNPLDLYWWCLLIIATCLSLAYL